MLERARAKWPIGVVVVATALAFVLAIVGLAGHPLWDDEANTALFARNYLRFGSLMAWDGQNIVAYRDGGELDEHLVNVYMPPLQYYVAAAGMRVFGQTTFGARIPFVIVGVLAIPIAAAWARRWFEREEVGALTAALLGLNPAYLLYARNCRYFALGFFFVALALYALTRPLGTRRDWTASLAMGALAMAGLTWSQTMYAGAFIVAAPAFFVLASMRTKRKALAFACMAAVTIAAALLLYGKHDPFYSQVRLADGYAMPRAEKTLMLTVWQLRDLAAGELAPVLLVPALLVPWALRAPERAMTFRGGAILLFAMVSIVATAAVSPQTIVNGQADIRYLTPLMIPGAALGAAALVALWSAWRPMAVAAGAASLTTNVATLGCFADQRAVNGYDFGPRGVTCPLANYVRDARHPYPTSTARLLDAMSNLPRGSVARFMPGWLLYPALFYQPDMHYAGQLDRKKPVEPSLRARLPDWVFWKGTPDVGEYLVIGGIGEPPHEGLLSQTVEKRGFEVVAWIDTYFEDRSRPEIMWHSFGKDELTETKDRGIVIVRITDAPTD
jgi:hypothetical protein